MARRVATDAAWLAPGGVLLFETSDRQAAAAVRAVRDASAGALEARVLTCGERDATVVVARARRARGE